MKEYCKHLHIWSADLAVDLNVVKGPFQAPFRVRVPHLVKLSRVTSASGTISPHQVSVTATGFPVESLQEALSMKCVHFILERLYISHNDRGSGGLKGPFSQPG